MLTPLEIHNKEFKKSFRGYDEDEVDEFLEQVINDYELLYKENMEVKDMLKLAENGMIHYKDLEESLKSALVVAQQTSDKMQANAQKEAELIIQEAKSKAELIIEEAQGKFERMINDYERMKNQIILSRVKLRSFLELQVAMVDEFEDGLIKVENNKSILSNVSKQEFIQEVQSEINHISDIDANITGIVEENTPNADINIQQSDEEVIESDVFDDHIAEYEYPNDNDFDIQTRLREVVGDPDSSTETELENYDFRENHQEEEVKQNTVMFSKEEIAAAIDENTVKEKNIF